MSSALVSVYSSEMSCWHDAERRLVEEEDIESARIKVLEIAPLAADESVEERWICLITVAVDMLEDGTEIKDLQAVRRLGIDEEQYATTL